MCQGREILQDWQHLLAFGEERVAVLKQLVSGYPNIYVFFSDCYQWYAWTLSINRKDLN